MDIPFEDAVCKAVKYDEMSITEKRLAVGMGNGTYQLYQDSNMDTGSVVGGIFVTRNLCGPHYEIVGRAALFHIHQGGRQLETVDFNILSADAQAEISRTFLGVGVGIHLSGGNVSIFDLNIGLGLSTGFGIKDDSVELKILGCGITVGRRLAISAFDCSFGLDFGKIFT